MKNTNNSSHYIFFNPIATNIVARTANKIIAAPPYTIDFIGQNSVLSTFANILDSKTSTSASNNATLCSKLLVSLITVKNLFKPSKFSSICLTRSSRRATLVSKFSMI